jgi:hypothetical protein
MKVLISILFLTSFYFLSCKPTPVVLGQTVIHFDTSKEFAVPKERLARTDTCVLRFRTDFNHDTIRILSDKNKHFIIATTDLSLAYAAAMVTKNNGDQIILEIADTRFTFMLRKDYLFIDIDYNKKTKRLDIYYSNNILVLS